VALLRGLLIQNILRVISSPQREIGNSYGSEKENINHTLILLLKIIINGILTVSFQDRSH
jgi:hypothetical protein